MQFTQIPGQELIKTRLLHDCNQGRLPHGILLNGPEGNGGLAIALSVITYLLCENKTPTDACGICDSCSKNASLIHPDVHFSFPIINVDGTKLSDVYLKEWRKTLISNPFMSYNDWMEAIKGKDDQNKQGNITAEECREMIKKLGLMSYEGGKKFMLLWLPEFLGLNGNILLKLLEEPPLETHIILVTEDMNQLLSTIISRTQLYNIPTFTEEQISEFLQTEHQIASKEALLISYLSKGNLSAAQHLMHEEDHELTNELKIWLQHCYSRNIQNINEWVNQTSTIGREKIKGFLENGLFVFGECLHCKFIPNYLPKVPESNQKFVLDISKILNENKINKIYNLINDVIFHIERNANAKISLFNLSLKLRTTLLEKD